MLFVDEAGFQLDPVTRSSWAPAKNPPILRPATASDRVSSIAAVTYDPPTKETGLVFQLQQTYYNRYTIAAFLQTVVAELDRDLLVIFDNWDPHTLAIEYLEETDPATASRLAVAYFPGYAPDVNPTEQLWTHVKYGELANYLPETIDQLQRTVDSRIAAKRPQQETLRNYIRTAGLVL